MTFCLMSFFSLKQLLWVDSDPVFKHQNYCELENMVELVYPAVKNVKLN